MLTSLQTIAAQNGGPFTRAEAVACGYTEARIRRLIKSRRWLVLRPGVYVEYELGNDSDPARRTAVQVAAIARALSAGTTVGSHESAALVHRYDLLHQPKQVTVTRPRQRGSTRSVPGVRVRSSRLPAKHICQQYGVTVTSPSRTVVDLARTLPLREAVVVADSAMRVAGLSRMKISAVAEDIACSPGIRQARYVIAFADGRAESALESLARLLFAMYKLPMPRIQVEIGQDRFIGRVDFYWDEYGVIGEADGMLKYVTHETLVAEKLRQEALENAGFRVVRFTWDDITCRPEQTVARIRQAFTGAERAN